MKPQHIRTLRISGFRGIRGNLELRLGKRLTIVYGGNASGKSSISQAIEFGLSGRVLNPAAEAIDPRFIRNDRVGSAGAVELELVTDSESVWISSKADDSRTSIEQRFRNATSVNWPDRLPLPVGQTHVTSQGLLTKVIASESGANSDLSSLCSVSDLRTSLARVESVADYLRQASTGRNFLSSLSAARTEVEAARALRQVIVSSAEPTLSADELGSRLSSLAGELPLNRSAKLEEVEEAHRQMMAQVSRKLEIADRLVERMKDLGRFEQDQALSILALKTLAQDELEIADKHKSAGERLHESKAALALAEQRLASENEIISRHSRRFAWASRSEALQTQLRNSIGVGEAFRQSLEEASRRLDAATSERDREAGEHAALAARLRTSEHHVSMLVPVLERLSRVSEDSLEGLRSEVAQLKLSFDNKQINLQRSESEFSQINSIASAAAAAFNRHSEEEAKYASAAMALRALVDDSSCTLCGHTHPSTAELVAAIDRTVQSRLSGSTEIRNAWEASVSAMRESEMSVTHARNALNSIRDRLSRVQAQHEQAQRDRQEALQDAERTIALLDIVLEANGPTIRRHLSHLQHEIPYLASQYAAKESALEDAVEARNDAERDFLSRRATANQLRASHADLERAASEHANEEPPDVEAAAAISAQTAARVYEGDVLSLQQGIAVLNDELLDTSKAGEAIALKRAASQSRLQSAEATLNALDEELRSIGATRSNESIIDTERALRAERQRLVEIESRLSILRDGWRASERNNAAAEADVRLRAAQVTLESLQRRNSILRERSSLFLNLTSELKSAQLRASENILTSVRQPVVALFRSMTAGCEWDIDLQLHGDGSILARLNAGLDTDLPATSLLNAAYFNVAAVALRLALGARQSWTRLRTIVLDDPILEMDQLTQSALLDGLEAVLSTNAAPWNDLQIVITTWSEDFAILASHKLAHLNVDTSSDQDAFGIYQLKASPTDGPVIQRHSPRWQATMSHT